ncbi:Grainyhead-like protein 2-like protein [Trichoplax sp. H2]|nr:Grainyhead-like protein 2-like protein [Trichoplax sp. H2]|eukprot:RDD39461.1 Grainyhead-like protein 2-like protein [Trichoplax sp. H2]
MASRIKKEPRKDSASSSNARKDSAGREAINRSTADNLKLSDYACIPDQLGRKASPVQYSDSNNNNTNSAPIVTKENRSWHSYLQNVPLPPTSPSVLLSGSSSNTDIDSNLTFLDYYCNVKSVSDESPDSNQSHQPALCTNDLESSLRNLANDGSSQPELNHSDLMSATNHSDPDMSSIVLPPFTSPSKSSTVFQAQERYKFSLEAPASIVHKWTGDALTYINKGQFYNINFEATPESNPSTTRLKSILHLVFREEKEPDNEMSHWQYWYSQQPNPNQRAFDIDRKSCQNVEERIEEIAYNAVAFYWNPADNAKIAARINCLSTDFSPQKGVKGIPLHLQIDTYEDLTSSDVEPVHRAFCKVKIFRDKGAERKNKDESKTARKRIQKMLKAHTQSVDASSAIMESTPSSTYLTPTTPLGPKPVLFMPYMNIETSNRLVLKKQLVFQRLENVNNTSTGSSNPSSSFFTTVRERENKRSFTYALAVTKDVLADLEVATPVVKTPRVARPIPPAVTIYVKKEEETAYHALMLKNCTVAELVDCLAKKYGVRTDMITGVYKRTKKGILVNMDDQIVEHFQDEDDFEIQLNFDNQTGHFDLILKIT